MSRYLPFLFDVTRWNDWSGWLDEQKATIGEHLTRIVIVIVLLLVVQFVFRRVVAGVLNRAIERAARTRREDPITVRRRAGTLINTLNWVFSIILVFLAAGFILGEIGLNVSALIAGVGVVGIALGLGAQTLVKDVINGMFILIEDQYSIGDTVTVAGATGEVVEINPRRTVVRDADGNVHVIPNSAITVAVNRTGSLSRFRVEIDVPFRDNDRAIDLANAVGADIVHELGTEVLAAPRVQAQRIVSEGDVRLVIIGDARQASRWRVESEYRRRLKRRFDAERVELKFEGAPAIT